MLIAVLLILIGLLIALRGLSILFFRWRLRRALLRRPLLRWWFWRHRYRPWL
jgi:hypothetical protein